MSSEESVIATNMDELDASAEQAPPLAAPSSSQEAEAAVTVAPPSGDEDNDCQMCEKQPAAQWCENCEKWMCDYCEDFHSQMPFDTAHKVTSRDDIKQLFNEAMTRVEAALEGRLEKHNIVIEKCQTAIKSFEESKMNRIKEIDEFQERFKKEIDKHFQVLKDQAVKSMNEVRDANTQGLQRMTEEAEGMRSKLAELKSKKQNEKYLTYGVSIEELTNNLFLESIGSPAQIKRMPEIKLQDNPEWTADCARLEIVELLPEQPALTDDLSVS